MSRVKKAGARTRSDVSNRALARAVDAVVDRLEGRLDALSMRLGAVERREEDRTFVKPEPAWDVSALKDRSDLPSPEFTRYGQASPATVPPLEIGAVQAKGVTFDKPFLAPTAAEEARAEKESRARDAEGVLESASRMARGSPGHLQMREECAIDPGVIERLNKALNGEFSSYLPEAPSHPVMLVLSEVVKLRKHLKAQNLLVRFLVERSGGLR